MKRLSALSMMILSTLTLIWTGCYTTFPIAGRADTAAAEPYMDGMEYDTDAYCGGPGLVVDDIGDDDVYVRPGICVDFHIGNSWAYYPYRSCCGVYFSWTNHAWFWDPWPVVTWPFWFDYPRPWSYSVFWNPVPHPWTYRHYTYWHPGGYSWHPWRIRHWDHDWAFHRQGGLGWNFHGKHHADWSRGYRQPVPERRTFGRRTEYAVASGPDRISRRTGGTVRRETTVIKGRGHENPKAGAETGRVRRTYTRGTSVPAAGSANQVMANESSRPGRNEMTRNVRVENPRPEENKSAQTNMRSKQSRAAFRGLSAGSNQENAAASAQTGIGQRSLAQEKIQSSSEQLKKSASSVVAVQKSRLQEARQVTGRRTESRPVMQAAERKPEGRQAVQVAERRPESRQVARAGSGRQENHVRSIAPARRSGENQKTQVSSGRSGSSSDRSKGSDSHSRSAARKRK
ncbi:hypothetical protein JW906_08915 [bacterium]|nr:hypothetical protein [bacterium]